jgi:fumarate hydratase class II
VSDNYRIESDGLGPVEVPIDSYYGANTQRAVQNFEFSSLRFHRRFIWAHALLKSEAARVNANLGVIPSATATAIVEAADEVAAGKWDSQIVVDVFQTGSGTSFNMNINEVVANRATEIAGGGLGTYSIHPNDHVNACQSSNDSVPTSLHLAAVAVIRDEVMPALQMLTASLERKATEFANVVKTGRTHLMDSLPITLGAEFGGYASQVSKVRKDVEIALPRIEELCLGGTVVGSGLNAAEGFAEGVVAGLAERTGYPLRKTDNHYEALAAKDGAANMSGVLRTVAIVLFKIANDIRWLASGPHGGIREIRLPVLQQGSSITPGIAKVNAVICEAVMQISAQVIGNDSTVAWSAANGNFELNVMSPVIGHNLIESAEILATAASGLSVKAVDGIEADEERCASLLDQNLTLVTALTPLIGYDAAAKVAMESTESGKSIAAIVSDSGLLTEEQISNHLDPAVLAAGGRASSTGR